jgi:DNA-binding transcriptional MocR family regulator
LRIEGVAAGLHLMVNLRSGTNEEAVVDAAARHSMRVYGLGPHRKTAGAPALLLGYGSLTEAQIEEGISLLATIIRNGRLTASKSGRQPPAVWDPIERDLKERIAKAAS